MTTFWWISGGASAVVLWLVFVLRLIAKLTDGHREREMEDVWGWGKPSVKREATRMGPH